MSIFIALLAFLVAIAILVTVHEFGHYWVAKKLGVKILRFSIGFGNPIYLRRFGQDQTEFVIAPIPLGGYVKMLGEADDCTPLSPDDQARAFHTQALWKRTAIVAAGPIFNFILAILLYAIVFMGGEHMIKPVIGAVQANSVAEAAGLQVGDQIIAVNGVTTQNWQDVLQTTLRTLLTANQNLTYTVLDQNNYTKSYSLDDGVLSLDNVAEGKFFEHLGVQPFHRVIQPVIELVNENSAADKAGMQPFDRILAIDGQRVTDWQMWAEYVQARPEQEIITTIQRGVEQLDLILVPDLIEGQGRMGVQAAMPKIPDEYFYIQRDYPITALIKGAQKTWDMTVLSVQILWKMLTLQVSPKHISGPITIADYAGKTVQISLIAFISFLALISLSLGIINLLPIPVLDGGHLLMYLIEWIKGSPVTEQMQYTMQQVGFVLLLGLMFLALFNDIGRLIGS
jgi:regulator of sigma E protease